ncbi:hypothetical protein ISN45_Aa04g029170 [Arabidopsis thaliana x Arabidopsis arenosa]|uniref:Uncharacterized protein n=2 Tax=Arabidopsis TaxID=3701 RepID=A0A8T2APS8_ARASU|nr:hypothetical protein ISN45_Aa04g029170 [Arabidopsis thaliana x Arabidopsis arenosa]KAG7574747.1 hypothetical protein ISN44_As09g029070 [Arabidopsis suecica]
MAVERKTAIVSIAVLVMIVAMTVTEVDGRTNFGRNLLEGQTNEGRNLYDIVGAVVGKHCCNKIITTCCGPAPAPQPTRKP